MPSSHPSQTLSSRQLRSQGRRPIAKEGFSGNTPASPEGERSFGLATEPTKHSHGMMDVELSSEGLDDSGMEVPPLLNTQHDVGVDADVSSEGQADICMDKSPSPQAQHSYGLDEPPSPQSQHSYGIDSAPLPEGLDFGMDLLPPSGAEEDAIKDIPQPKDVHGESSAVYMFTDRIIPLTLLVQVGCGDKTLHHPLMRVWRKQRRA